MTDRNSLSGLLTSSIKANNKVAVSTSSILRVVKTIKENVAFNEKVTTSLEEPQQFKWGSGKTFEELRKEFTEQDLAQFALKENITVVTEPTPSPVYFETDGSSLNGWVTGGDGVFSAGASGITAAAPMEWQFACPFLRHDLDANADLNYELAFRVAMDRVGIPPYSGSFQVTTYDETDAAITTIIISGGDGVVSVSGDGGALNVTTIPAGENFVGDFVLRREGNVRKFTFPGGTHEEAFIAAPRPVKYVTVLFGTYPISAPPIALYLKSFSLSSLDVPPPFSMMQIEPTKTTAIAESAWYDRGVNSRAMVALDLIKATIPAGTQISTLMRTKVDADADPTAWLPFIHHRPSSDRLIQLRFEFSSGKAGRTPTVGGFSLKYTKVTKPTFQYGKVRYPGALPPGGPGEPTAPWFAPDSVDSVGVGTPYDPSYNTTLPTDISDAGLGALLFVSSAQGFMELDAEIPLGVRMFFSAME